MIPSIAMTIAVKSVVSAVTQDAKDNPILACGVDGMADYVVTGDRHLLDMVEFEGISLVTPAQFLEVLNRQV